MAAAADGGLDATLVYATDLFDGPTMAAPGRRATAALLAAVVADPRAEPLSELRRDAVRRWPTCSRPPRPASPGDRPSWRGGESLTYAELDARANRLAHHLQAAGVGADATVGVCMARSVDLAVALLGVLKAGGACVPLDPAYPAERLAFMADDAGLAAVLTDASAPPTMSSTTGRRRRRPDRPTQSTWPT